MTLSHCAFLTTVLSENPAYHNLAFQVGMFGLELARLPASTKPMEVKLAHQESELVALLKRLPLGSTEMSILRERARQLQDGTVKSRGDLLPLMLAAYTFDSLVTNHPDGSPPSEDEQLGFEAAVAAIGMKANVKEAVDPLLCEGTRRQRGDLALSLLVHYKDSAEKVARIMDKLLDKEVHPDFKSPLMPSYYVSGSTSRRQQQQQQRQRQEDLNQRMENLQLHQQQQQQRQPAPPPANNFGARPRADNNVVQQPEAFNPPPAAPLAGGGALAADRNNWDSYESWEREREQQQRVGRQSQPPQRPAQPPSGGVVGANSRHRPGSDSGSSGNSSGDSIVSSSSSSRRNHPLPDGASGGSGNGLFPPPTGVPPPAAASLVNDGLLENPPYHTTDRPPPTLASGLSAMAATGRTGM